MAKKKQKKSAQQVFLSPEKYIKQKARSLKIKECYITEDFDTVGLGHVIVAREHTGGRITLGAYLVDKFCLGVKDSFYRLRIDSLEFEEFLDRLNFVGIRKISYEEAHNIIYGAIEFAEEAGIKPHKSFALTKYILEEDTEDIPLIKHEFGKDGKHYLFVHSMLEASEYLPTLRKNLGDDFDFCIGDEGEEYEGEEYDEEEYDDKEYE